MAFGLLPSPLHVVICVLRLGRSQLNAASSFWLVLFVFQSRGKGAANKVPPFWFVLCLHHSRVCGVWSELTISSRVFLPCLLLACLRCPGRRSWRLWMKQSTRERRDSLSKTPLRPTALTREKVGTSYSNTSGICLQTVGVYGRLSTLPLQEVVGWRLSQNTSILLATNSTFS